ncbi:uncharacterized protein B0I36DRAFT_235359, partial [Microdochium trichocladiopsis]
HGLNPSATTWLEIADAIRAFYGAERLPEMISFQEWVRRLEMSGHEGNDDNRALVSRNPGFKLLDTYHDMAQEGQAGRPPVVLSMQRTVAQSPAMRQCKAITADLVKRWCKQWDF